MFGTSMAMTSGMALATSGSTVSGGNDPDAYSNPEKDKGVTLKSSIKALSVLVVIWSLGTCAAGWITLAAGVVLLTIGDEAHGAKPVLSGGPNFHAHGGGLGARVFLFLGIVCAGGVPFLCYFARLWFRLRTITK